jgi:lysophospholipid acyltransferase (LPLAT)-like uncharacterized protein
MKLRNPALIKALGSVLAPVIRLWIGTLRFRYLTLGPDINPNKRGLTGRYLYSFWHETMLLPAYHYSRPDVWVLISQSADGELIAEACRRLSLKTVRGSANRDGIKAVRELMRLGGKDHVVITPDGPRGPRRQVHPGVIFVASKIGLPIVPVGVGFKRAWRMKSWDRFAIPRPWSGSACVIGEPIPVPEKVDKNQLEHYRQVVQEAMDQVTEAAERLRV